MAASHHGDTPHSGNSVTSVPVTPYTTSVDVNAAPSRRREKYICPGGISFRHAQGGHPSGLTEALGGLDPTEDDQARARATLLNLLSRSRDSWRTQECLQAVSRLNLTVSDLEGSDAWLVPPGSELMAVARNNSTITAWLSSLRPPSGRRHIGEIAGQISMF